MINNRFPHVSLKLCCKTLKKIYKEDKRLLLFPPLLPLSSRLWLHSGAQSGSDSTGCSKWLMKMAGGLLCLQVLQLNHTVLNMALGSTSGLVSLWVLSGRHDYWSDWQIKAGNGAGGWRWGGNIASGGGCTEEKKTMAPPDQKWTVSLVPVLHVLQRNVAALGDYGK